MRVVACAKRMVGQAGDNPTFSDSAARALGDNAAEFRLECCQLTDPPVDFGQLLLCQSVDIGTGLVGVIRQVQQSFNRAQRKPQIAGMADELQAGDVGFGIKAPVAVGSGRGG